MPDIDNKYSYVAERREQRAHIFNFVEVVDAMVRFIREIDDSLPACAQMPMDIVYKRPGICHMLDNIGRIYGVKNIPEIESFLAKITASQFQILVVLPVVGA